MKKLSSLNHSAKQTFLAGVILIFFGFIHMIFGSQVPRLMYELFFTYLFFSALWSLLSRWFRSKQNREPLLVSLAKIFTSVIFANVLWLENATIYLLVFPIAIYQIFTGFVNLVTWYLYRINQIKPRFRLLVDGLWIGALGVYSLSPFHDAANYQLAIMGFYLISLGLTRLRDAFFFNADASSGQLKRRVRVSLPIFLSALIPAATLDKVNRYLLENEGSDADKVYNQIKDGKDAEMEIFVHTAETSLFSKIGHVDLCYQGRVISFGNYDPDSERLMGMIGDGVLYKCDRDSYIELCKKESAKTLFGYGIDLTEAQEKAVQERLAEIDHLLVPWEPSDKKRPIGNDKEDYTYAYKIKTKTNGQLYKFTGSKFKTYFVLSTNCVLLADSILGKAGTDILSPKGFIAPGTFQNYLDHEFERPNSLVVSKIIY
ncbi:DUF308 domain-containing protein [Streptococcus suis]|uniref:DUF308 domain-containing protein n=1 Tax=Streptococcus suis TaxID=1307 RepID=UPI003010117D